MKKGASKSKICLPKLLKKTIISFLKRLDKGTLVFELYLTCCVIKTIIRNSAYDNIFTSPRVIVP